MSHLDSHHTVFRAQYDDVLIASRCTVGTRFLHSLMSVTIAGVSCLLFYSPDACPSRVSVQFAENSKKPIHNTAYGPSVTLSLTVQTLEGCYTGVIDFLVDPDCQVDVLIGSDWVDMCISNGVVPGVDAIAVYGESESVCIFGFVFLTSPTVPSPSLLPDRVEFRAGLLLIFLQN